ncbi:MAG: hypothetical protein ABFD24_09440 [Anaerolineaceae bacterium]
MAKGKDVFVHTRLSEVESKKLEYLTKKQMNGGNVSLTIRNLINMAYEADEQVRENALSEPAREASAQE